MPGSNKEINVFNMSMLDVISGAMGAFLLVMLVLVPYYGKTVKEEEVKDVRDAISSAEDNLNRTQAALAQAQSDAERVQILDQALTQAQRDLETVQNAQQATMSQMKAAQRQLQKEVKDAEDRLGLVLQDHNLVFVIDVSRSMGPPEGNTPPFNTFENSIVAVVAGVKMLVATMDETYKMDIVFFPNHVGNFPGTPTDQDYGRMWGELRPVTEDRKYEAYEFLSSLQPFNGTPTEGAMDYVLGERNYADAAAVILMSDGAPSNAQGQLSASEVDQLAVRLTQQNNGRFKINALGVGSEFRDQNAAGDAVRFLKTLADRNDGFYVGF